VVVGEQLKAVRGGESRGNGELIMICAGGNEGMHVAYAIWCVALRLLEHVMSRNCFSCGAQSLEYLHRGFRVGSSINQTSKVR
jgi:hypothetical protein